MLYLFGWNAISHLIIDELYDKSILINGIIMDKSFITDDIVNNCKYKIFDFNQMQFNIGDTVINCLGYKDLFRRKIVGEKLLALNVLKSHISAKADVSSSAKISDGVILLGNVTIEANAFIGSHSIIWGGARVCHDAHLGSSVFMAAGSILGGYSTIGDFGKIGFNSAIKQETIVPNNTIIGACSYYK